jgi:hypothetical protein
MAPRDSAFAREWQEVGQCRRIVSVPKIAHATTAQKKGPPKQAFWI